MTVSEDRIKELTAVSETRSLTPAEQQEVSAIWAEIKGSVAEAFEAMEDIIGGWYTALSALTPPGQCDDSLCITCNDDGRA